jgi:hypothetical protein
MQVHLYRVTVAAQSGIREELNVLATSSCDAVRIAIELIGDFEQIHRLGGLYIKAQAIQDTTRFQEADKCAATA